MPSAAKVRWTIFVSEDIDADLRALLGPKADSPDELSNYVERAVALAIFDAQADEPYRPLDPEEVEREVDAAVREVRQEMYRERLRSMAAEKMA